MSGSARADGDGFRLCFETQCAAPICPRPPGGRSSTLSVFPCKSVLHAAFVWARRALKHRKRRFPARAGAVVVLPWQDGPCFDQAGFNADVKQVSPPQPAPLAARAPLQTPI